MSSETSLAMFSFGGASTSATAWQRVVAPCRRAAARCSAGAAVCLKTSMSTPEYIYNNIEAAWHLIRST
jgi:hypothetical protein